MKSGHVYENNAMQTHLYVVSKLILLLPDDYNITHEDTADDFHEDLKEWEPARPSTSLAVRISIYFLPITLLCEALKVFA